MSYQRGSLKQENRKEGVTWLLRYRVNSPDGKRVENTLPIGLVRDFPSKGDAWREVDRLGLGNRINSEEYVSGAIKFAALAEFYLKTDYGEDAGRPKSDTSIPMLSDGRTFVGTRDAFASPSAGLRARTASRRPRPRTTTFPCIRYWA
jgi:hypothetical protein